MELGLVLDTMRGFNLHGLRLAVKDRQLAREYWSSGMRRYDELMGHGLPSGDPVEYVCGRGWAARSTNDRVTLPAVLDTAGGTRLDELLVLGAVTSVLKPRRIFEIGTFMGRTTSVFVLNAPSDADVVTLDLPPDSGVSEGRVRENLETDLELINQRRIGSLLHQIGLDGRYRQVFADSLEFDEGPYAGSIELGFIDGAHARHYVESDTRKMAIMAADRGLIFWHDYGGKGSFRALTGYLDDLSLKIPLFRVPNTTLAWAPAPELKALFATVTA